MFDLLDSTVAAVLPLADNLQDPAACLPPGFSGPVVTVLGWVKALGLVIAMVAFIRVGVHFLRQQGDGVPDRDDTMDKFVNLAIGICVIMFAFSLLSALGAGIAPSC